PVPYGKHLIVEGAGGVLVPLNGRHTMLDLMQHLQVPVVVVARTQLGTINHTLLTLEALNARNIKIFGIVLNGEPNEDNRRSIEHFGGVPVIAQIERLHDLSRASLAAVFEREFGNFV
ncbi:MAG TPA: AAA family ATPase, partial [Candidatus Obscuribacterales bacterium]